VRVVALPTTFRVGVLYGAVSGSGTLQVESGAIRLQPRGATKWAGRIGSPGGGDQREVVQRSPRVKVVLSRIPAPVVNTSVVVSSGEVTAVAGVPPWQRKRLLTALDAAGFTVERETAWLSLGSKYVTPWP
jgi:hypothetical protein